MTSWGTVLLAAAAAAAGGLTTAWFARPMKVKTPTGSQPIAIALLALRNDAARDQRQQEERRPAYLEFLVRVDVVLGATGVPAEAERRSVTGALDVLELVGPAGVVETARRLAALAQRDGGSPPSEVEQVRTAFLTSARTALGASGAELPQTAQCRISSGPST